MREAAVELIARFIAAARAQGLGPHELWRLRLERKKLLALSGPVMLTDVVERRVRHELRNDSITLERDLHQLLRPTRLGSTVCVPRDELR